MLGLLGGAEGGADWQAVDSKLARFQPHFQGSLSCKLCGHKATVYLWVEPGIVAGCEVRYYSCKFHWLLQPLPAYQHCVSAPQPLLKLQILFFTPVRLLLLKSCFSMQAGLQLTLRICFHSKSRIQPSCTKGCGHDGLVKARFTCWGKELT